MEINVKSVKWVGKFAISLLIMFCISNSGRGQWVQTNGPLYGYVRSMVVFGDTVFSAAGYGGGIYRSTNHGTDWSKIITPFDSFPTKALLKRDDRIFATSTNGIFCSSDTGKHWVNCGPFKAKWFFNSIAQNTKYIFVMDGNIIYRSSDNGDSWIVSDSTVPPYTYFFSFGVNDTTIFVGTDKGIFRSTDLGHSWSKADTLRKTAVLLSMIKSIGDTVFASSFGLFYSTDNGTKWTVLNDSIEGLDMIRLGNTLIVTGYNGIFKSMDNGLHWAQANIGLHDLNVRSIVKSSGNLLVGTTTDWIYRSTDSGNSWIRMKGGIIESETKILTATGNSLFASTEDIGLYRSLDEGNSWIPVNSEITDYNVGGFAVKDRFLYRGGNRGGNYYLGISTNNGDDWTFHESPPITILWVHDSSIFSNDYQDLFRSTDNGGIWQNCLVDSGINGGLYITAFSSIKNTLFASGRNRGY